MQKYIHQSIIKRMKHFTQNIFKSGNAQYLFLLLFFAMATVSFAQDPTADMKPKGESIQQIFEKRSYNGPMHKYPMASPETQRKAKEAAGQPLNFTERVWFPGEWEEVKAIVVSPYYLYRVPGKEEDGRYYAEPVFEGYANYYYQKDLNTDVKECGNGPYVSILDTKSEMGMIFLRIMDGIQKGGAEAWVRIESAGDEEIILNTLKEYGFQTDKMKFFVGPGDCFWFRDCGPICFYYGDDDEIGMLDFYYRNRNLDDMLPSLLHKNFNIRNFKNMIAWEGGNCLVDGLGSLVTSTAVYDENNTNVGPLVWDGKNPASIRTLPRKPIPPMDVKYALQGLLGQNQTTVLQRLYNDGGTGHIDLYVDAKDENGFLLAQMPEKYKYWNDYDAVFGNTAILLNKDNFFNRKYYSMGFLPFPSRNDGSYFENEEDYLKYTRSYANHTFVNNYILQPCFSPVGEDGMPTADWDRANIEYMKKLYPGYTFYCIDIRRFDADGGAIHCVTKQIPADNPIRIIHKSIHDKVNPDKNSGIPFCAYITNKSGIKEAQLVYSVNGGPWVTVPLAGNGNNWNCWIPIDDITGGQPESGEEATGEEDTDVPSVNGRGIKATKAYHGDDVTVFYYIQATSNNGKTITKPFNAYHGDFYDFTLTDKVPYDESMFDFAVDPMPKDYITFILDTKYLTEDVTTAQDAPTAIKEVNNYVEHVTDNAWYTIDGTRLSTRPSTKGVYIFKGKKIVIK